MLMKSSPYIYTPDRLDEKRTPYAAYLLAGLFAAGFALGALPAFAGTAMVHGGLAYKVCTYAQSESYSYSRSSHDDYGYDDGHYDDSYESRRYDHGAYGRYEPAEYGAIQRYHAQADRYDEQADRYDAQSCWYEETVMGYGCGPQAAFYSVPHPGDPYYDRRRSVDHGY